jgi:hypothetical protein
MIGDGASPATAYRSAMARVPGVRSAFVSTSDVNGAPRQTHVLLLATCSDWGTAAIPAECQYLGVEIAATDIASFIAAAAATKFNTFTAAEIAAFQTALNAVGAKSNDLTPSQDVATVGKRLIKATDAAFDWTHLAGAF